MNKKIIISILAILIIIGILMINKETSTEARTIKIGHLTSLTAASLYIAEEKKLFDEAGLNVEMVAFSSANEIYDALVRGDIDYVSSTGVMQVLINEPKVGGIVKIAGMSSLVPGSTFDKLITIDEKITTLKDLEGKKIGVFPGTTPTTFLKLFLKKNNVNIDKITFIQLPPQSQAGALEAGSIDVLFGYEPVPAIIESKNPKVKVLASDLLADVYLESPVGVRLATENFMCQRKGDFNKLQRAIDKAQDLIVTDKDEYAHIISGDMNIPVEVLKIVNPYATFPVDKNKFAAFEDFLVKNGELKQKTNLDSLFNCI